MAIRFIRIDGDWLAEQTNCTAEVIHLGTGYEVMDEPTPDMERMDNVFWMRKPKKNYTAHVLNYAAEMYGCTVSNYRYNHPHRKRGEFTMISDTRSLRRLMTYEQCIEGLWTDLGAQPLKNRWEALMMRRRNFSIAISRRAVSAMLRAGLEKR